MPRFTQKRTLLPFLVGLVLLSATDGTQRSDWWSLRPLAKPEIPAIDSLRIRNPVDAFVLRRLQREGLDFARDADRRTLIRRLTFDLHGLPPTPDEVVAFLADDKPGEYERLVDRLLASPRYGERWGRHWLDVVHYGETHGYDKDKVRRNAWPYRDYVIRAFNGDKPYRDFVREQLAGDVLYRPKSRSAVVATGFIAAGPWDFVGHVELREGTVDKKITRNLDRDDMVTNAMSTFVSTTAHCARCHDHKFDPIPQRDYYRLQAVFAGVERADREYLDPREAESRRRIRDAIASLRQKRDAVLRELDAVQTPVVDAKLVAAKTSLAALDVAVPKTKSVTLGYHSRIEAAPNVRKWVQVDLGRSYSIDALILLPAHVRFGGHPGPGFGFPPEFDVRVSDDPEFAQSTPIADFTAEPMPHPGDRPVVFDGQSAKARYVRVTATRLWKRTGDWIFALGELAVISGGRNVAAGARVTSLDSIEAKPSWSRPNLTDGHTSRQRVAPETVLAQIARHGVAVQRLEAERRLARERALRPDRATEWKRTRTVLRDHERMVAELPPPPRVYAAARQFRRQGNFRPPNGIRPVHLLKRGSVKMPGEQVAPGALSALPALTRHFARLDVKGNDPKAEGARRLALANWIVDKDNPLTWRSIVNRVWHYHFGQGIVRTPNDFGHMGDQPSHPELLDWLAMWFRDNGGSFKELHKLIVTSSTYRQSSANRPAAAQKDGGNRLLWRGHRRRLEAECVRDGVLALSGRLDLKMGGPSVSHFAFKDDHSPHYDYDKFDVDSPDGRRRSVYRLIVRSVADPFMERLDCPDASLSVPARYTTITAPQALALLNNRFMVRHAEHFAARLRREAETIDAQIGLAFHLAFGRRPRAGETSAFAGLAADHGLEPVCRAILNSNEFLFVD